MKRDVWRGDEHLYSLSHPNSPGVLFPREFTVAESTILRPTVYSAHLGCCRREGVCMFPGLDEALGLGWPPCLVALARVKPATL